MALTNIEKLQTSVVLVTQGEFEAKLSGPDFLKIIREPHVEFVPPPIGAIRITSIRDQVEIVVMPGRIQMRDHSDTLPGTGRFPQIVAEFATLLTQMANAKYASFGWNFDIAFSLDTEVLPAKVIADRFINREAIRNKTGLDVSGGGVRLFYTSASTRYTLYLEPRENRPDSTRFSAHMNVHFDTKGTLPSSESLGVSFKKGYDTFVSVISTILA